MRPIDLPGVGSIQIGDDTVCRSKDFLRIPEAGCTPVPIAIATYERGGHWQMTSFSARSARYQCFGLNYYFILRVLILRKSFQVKGSSWYFQR